MGADFFDLQECSSANTLTLEGITFRTSGNILFQDSEESPFVMASSSLLDHLDCFLEHGMQMLIKKIKP